MLGLQRLSIRSRLTVISVGAVAVGLVLTATLLVGLVHRSLVTGVESQVNVTTANVAASLDDSFLNTHKPTEIHTAPGVVVQLTNAKGTQVWAASPSILYRPVLATGVTQGKTLVYQFTPSVTNADRNDLFTYGVVRQVRTDIGTGYLFGFAYGNNVAHSTTVLLATISLSFPLLLVISALLIWLALGLAFRPVDEIRRRVDAIAARDLSGRVPVPSGHDEISMLALTLNAMLARLEIASKSQSEFISNASHELRSPLTTLLATVERAASDPSWSQWDDTAAVVVLEGRRLDALIDDLLWLARNDEQGHLRDVREVDLDDILLEEARRVRTLGGVSVDTSAVTPVRVMGDGAMLTRMIRNVVDNGRRHASSNLRFTSRYDGTDGVITIGDDGPGVSDVDRDRLFDRFVRADDARTRESGGTGIGLAIVKDIAQRHGGNAQFLQVPLGACVQLRVKREII
jgi:signal transduction histidine kinase